MQNLFILSVIAVLGYFCSCATAKAAKSNTKCDASPLTYILETYYHGHPFRNVNLKRDESHWEKVYRIGLGEKNNYQIEKAAGKGKFSKVFRSIYLPTNEEVALKLLVHNKDEKITKEIQIMLELKDCPNALPIRDMLKEEGSDGEERTALIFPFFDAPHYRELFPTLNKYQIKLFIYGTLEALHYAHSKGIAHRDIKPLNVLMSGERNEVKVIDWGHSDYYLPGKEYSVRIASLHFKSPELLLNFELHDYSLDIWSTGCLLAEMMFLKMHFFQSATPIPKEKPGENATEIKFQGFREHLDAIAQVLGTAPLKRFVNKYKDYLDVGQMRGVGDYTKQPWTNFITEENAHLYDPLAADLLDKMLVFDHTRRLTAEEALWHPYFNEIRANRRANK